MYSRSQSRTLKETLSFEESQKSSLFKWIPNEVEEQYMDEVFKPRLVPRQPNDLKIVYTAMHGVGYAPFKKVMDRAGYTACFPGGTTSST